MRIRYFALTNATLSVALLATACGSATTPDCATLPPPTPEQIAVANQALLGEPIEVEVELENEMGTTECVLIGDRWLDHTDEAVED